MDKTIVYNGGKLKEKYSDIEKAIDMVPKKVTLLCTSESPDTHFTDILPQKNGNTIYPCRHILFIV